MRRLMLLGCVVVGAVACTSRDETPVDSAGAVADTGAAASASAATSSADRIGTWEGRSLEADSVVATWRLEIAGDSTGWTLHFPEGQPIPMRVVALACDSVVTEFGPFESPVTRQMVNVRSVGRMEGRDRQAGTYEARPVSNPDSVTRGRWEATRVP